MKRLCIRCKRDATNDWEHEFCTFVKVEWFQPPTATSPGVPIKEPEIPFGGEPPHRPSREALPVQQPITRNLARRGSKPPTRRSHDFDDNLDGTRQDLARKLAED